MLYKLLGETGLRVSQVALGGGAIGTGWGWGADRDESRAIFDGFAEAGGNFLDLADGYQGGEAERLIGEFVRADREHFIVSSKYSGGTAGNTSVARCGNSRKSMIQGLEGSLKRLGLDRIDLYYVHFADGVTPTDEIARGVEEIVRGGKALYFGFSNFPAWRIARAATIAELRGWPRPAAIQVEYSLVERTAERELLPMAEAFGLAVTVWAALGGGLLTGKYRRGAAEGRLSRGGGRVLRESGERERRILDALEDAARKLGATPAQVAIAWVLAMGRTRDSAVIPILGARTATQLVDNLGALGLDLPADVLAQLDQLSATPAGYPHEWLASSTIEALKAAGRPETLSPKSLPVR